MEPVCTLGKMVLFHVKTSPKVGSGKFYRFSFVITHGHIFYLEIQKKNDQNDLWTTINILEMEPVCSEGKILHFHVQTTPMKARQILQIFVC